MKSAVRYICLVAILLALPLNAGAQQRRAADRRSDQNRSEQRPSNERRSEERRSDDHRSNGRKSDERGPAAKPPAHASTLPWWENQPPPWWERQQAPAWEQQRRTPPPFELGRIPGYSQGNVARALIEQQRYGPHGNNPRRSSRYYRPSVAYVLPSYGYFTGSVASTTTYDVTPPASAVTVYAEPEPTLPPMGALRLEVEPKESLQIYVDGVFVGTPADNGEEIELSPGVRRIELRAPGYRSLTFSAEILDGRLITYRGTLDRDDAERPAEPRTVAPAAPAAPAARSIMYVIPGCYLGNVSPQNVALPPGCDISKLTTISP